MRNMYEEIIDGLKKHIYYLQDENDRLKEQIKNENEEKHVTKTHYKLDRSVGSTIYIPFSIIKSSVSHVIGDKVVSNTILSPLSEKELSKCEIISFGDDARIEKGFNDSINLIEYFKIEDAAVTFDKIIKDEK